MCVLLHTTSQSKILLHSCIVVTQQSINMIGYEKRGNFVHNLQESLLNIVNPTYVYTLCKLQMSITWSQNVYFYCFIVYCGALIQENLVACITSAPSTPFLKSYHINSASIIDTWSCHMIHVCIQFPHSCLRNLTPLTNNSQAVVLPYLFARLTLQLLVGGTTSA